MKQSGKVPFFVTNNMGSYAESAQGITNASIKNNLALSITSYRVLLTPAGTAAVVTVRGKDWGAVTGGLYTDLLLLAVPSLRDHV
jgi:hypothetical protein